MLPKNWGEPMGAPEIFEKQTEIKLLPPASTLESRIQVSVKLPSLPPFAGGRVCEKLI
ncbi:MAG: hypothetical protein P8X74_12055 [Reinekea sp.]